MKIIILSLMTTIFLVGCSHHHHSHSHKNHTNDKGLTLNQGQKWETDEVMRNNMERIHSGLLKLKKAEKSGMAVQTDYLSFYATVQSATETIITNCRMSPEMDQAYHVILEKMLEEAEKLKDTGTQKNVSDEFVSAFMQYQKYFDHNLKH